MKKIVFNVFMIELIIANWIMALYSPIPWLPYITIGWILGCLFFRNLGDENGN